MSKYNNYARKLNAAFKAARDEYSAALSELAKYQKALNRAQNMADEEYIGEREAAIADANAEIIRARAKLDNVKANVWKAYDAEIKQLTKQLQADLSKDNIASSEAVDMSALELLKSGIMSVDDMEAMAAKFDSNPTMLRLISKYAREVADDETALPVTRGGMARVANATKDGNGSVMRNWNTLTTMANIYSGRGETGTRPCSAEISCEMSSHWDDMAREAIENF